MPPLANPNGPPWTRPLAKTAEQRLSGLNPIRTFLAGLFRQKPPSPSEPKAGPRR